jgi:hypothetical protein
MNGDLVALLRLTFAFDGSGHLDLDFCGEDRGSDGCQCGNGEETHAVRLCLIARLCKECAEGARECGEEITFFVDTLDSIPVPELEMWLCRVDVTGQ